MYSKPNDTPDRPYAQRNTKTHTTPWQKTQWDRPTMSNATSRDGRNPTNVEPSAAPSASRYVATVDGPARKPSSSRKREELPHGEKRLIDALGFSFFLLTCWCARKYCFFFFGLVAYFCLFAFMRGVVFRLLLWVSASSVDPIAGSCSCCLRRGQRYIRLQNGEGLRGVCLFHTFVGSCSTSEHQRDTK